MAWDALQELYGLYEANGLQGALEALNRFGDLYNTGAIPEYHDTVDTILNWDRRNPRLAPRQMVQQTPRRNQQPPTNPPQNRTRVHQPPQLRRPRPITNMIHATTHPKKTRRAHDSRHHPSQENAQGHIRLGAFGWVLHSRLRRTGAVRLGMRNAAALGPE